MILINRFLNDVQFQSGAIRFVYAIGASGYLVTKGFPMFRLPCTHAPFGHLHFQFGSPDSGKWQGNGSRRNAIRIKKSRLLCSFRRSMAQALN